MTQEQSIFFHNFKAVAAEAAAFELECRLTADVSAATSSVAIDGTMEQILEQLRTHHSSCLNDGEWEHLGKSGNQEWKWENVF